MAEIGGARHAGTLTGAATACSWSGTIVGPLLFAALLGASSSYVIPWLVLSVVAAAVALTLPRLAPLVQRG